MPANPLSLRITTQYSARLKAVANRVRSEADRRWSLDPADFDGSYAAWLESVTPVVTEGQRENVRLTAGYVGAFLSSELRKWTRPPRIDPGPYVGVSRDGRPFTEAWTSPPIKAKVAIEAGREPSDAADIARKAAMSLVVLDTYQAARLPLAETLQQVEVVIGYRRVTGGDACGACLAAETGAVLPDDEVFEYHPSCDCVAEPVLDLPQRAEHPTGTERFNAMSNAEQRQLVGDAAAEAIRKGQIGLSDLLGHAPMKAEPDFLVQRPLEDA